MHIREHLFERKVAHDLFEVLFRDVMTYDDILSVIFLRFFLDFLGFRFFHINYLRSSPQTLLSAVRFRKRQLRSVAAFCFSPYKW